MNVDLSDLLKEVSFVQHSLNGTLDLAIRAGHGTRGLERVINLLEREMMVMRTTMRRQAEAETRSAAASAANVPAEANTH